MTAPQPHSPPQALNARPSPWLPSLPWCLRNVDPGSDSRCLHFQTVSATPSIIYLHNPENNASHHCGLHATNFVDAADPSQQAWRKRRGNNDDTEIDSPAKRSCRKHRKKAVISRRQSGRKPWQRRISASSCPVSPCFHHGLPSQAQETLLKKQTTNLGTVKANLRPLEGQPGTGSLGGLRRAKRSSG